MADPTTDLAAEGERVVLWPVATLTALSLPVLFWGLGSGSLAHGDEGFYHLVARNMLETGDWTWLEFTGEPRPKDALLNAPIFYWAKAALIWVLGDNYWSMRLLSAAFGLLSVLATYRLTAYVAGRRAGVLAGLLLLTTYHFIHYHGARAGVLEPLVMFCLIMAADSFLRALDRDKGFIVHNLYLIALVNLKSPLLVVPVAAELAYFLIHPAARRHLRRWATTGLAMLPLGLVWHGYQYIQFGPDGFWGAVGGMTARASGELGSPETRGVAHHARYYGHTLLFGAFPWVLAAPLALVGLFGSGRGGLRGKHMLVLMPACLLGFFLAVSNYFSWYMIPLYPFLAAIVGIWIVGLARSEGRSWPIGAVAFLGGLMAVLRVNVLEMNPYASRRMDVGAESFGGLPPWVTFVAVAVAAAGALSIADRWAKERLRPLLSWGLVGVLLAYGGVRVLAPLRFSDHQTPMAELRRQIDADLAAGRNLDFPISVSEGGNPKVRFYFGDDFVIRRVDREGVFYELVGPGRTPGDPMR